MGIFKKIFGGMKDRMKAVDNLTQGINKGDVSIKVLTKDEKGSENKIEKKGALGSFKDRMKAVENLTNSINSSSKND